MGSKRSIAFALVFALGTTGCASVYVNDPDLAKSADAADASIQATDTLKPYATQLTNLQAYSAQEDLAVADLDVAQRDQLVTGFIRRAEEDRANTLSQPRWAAPADSAPTLNNSICGQLNALVGNTPCENKARLATLATFIDGSAKWQVQLNSVLPRINSDRATYERSRPASDTRKDDCDTLDEETISSDTDAQLWGLQQDCGRLKHTNAQLTALYTSVGAVDGADIATTLNAVVAADATPKTPTSDQVAKLQAEVKAAADLAKTGAVPNLETFRGDVEAILKGSSGAAQALGWQQVQTALGDALTGILCSETPAAGKAPTAGSGPDCSKVQAASTSGRAGAVWTLLQAIAQTFDANDPRMRSASWLAAANAIAAGEKANAQVQADADNRAAASRRLRLSALVYTVSRLAQARQILDGDASCVGTAPSNCALAAFVDSWNTGIIPADILEHRDIEIFREVDLQQRLAAQTEQQSLTRAASASLKAYSDGGVQPATIAQLISDAAIIGVAAAK